MNVQRTLSRKEVNKATRRSYQSLMDSVTTISRTYTNPQSQQRLKTRCVSLGPNLQDEIRSLAGKYRVPQASDRKRLIKRFSPGSERQTRNTKKTVMRRMRSRHSSPLPVIRMAQQKSKRTSTAERQ